MRRLSKTERTRLMLTLNGRRMSADAEPRLLLSDFLRQALGATGTHVGCDTSQCGACVVHVDGQSVKSCTMLAVQAEGAKVTTIEGLAKDGKLHPMQEAFRENHGLQCGFCTPGMIMTAVALLKANKNPTDADIDAAMTNICRCGTYQAIRAAIHRVAGGR